MGLSVVALALATSLAGTATASSPDVRAAHKGQAASAVGTDATCFSNLTGDTLTAITSQNFETPNDAYDSYGADDVKLKKTCKVTSIQVMGQYYGGTGPADSETVTIYKNDGGKPGAVVKTKTVQGTDDGLGSFDIPFTVTLKKGKTYWVGVQANMDFSVGGQWGWENTTTAKKAPAQWQNPGDGFATGCTTWGNMQTCLGGVAPGPDFMFAISK
jgi:hypothetical protein